MSFQQYFTEEHDMLRQTTRQFVAKEILPFVDEWEEAGTFPRELYKKSADVGICRLGYPEEVGGIPSDLFGELVVWEEMNRSGSGGLNASLGSHAIALPPIVSLGTPAQKETYVRPVLAGERIAALAITEPSGGSDVARLQTTATRDGDHYIVNGSKTFITSGYRADQITCAVRTGGPGFGGISLLIIDADLEGYSTSQPLKKMGWWPSDTAQIFLDNVRVPVENLIGVENQGFIAIMLNFQKERLMMAVGATTAADMALQECLRYVKERETFGKSLERHQVIRHKLADMATLVEVSREYNYRVAAKMSAGVDQVTEVSMAKNFACDIADQVMHQAVQIFGGYGFMREYLVERLYRDNRIMSIGGGTREIMNEVIAKRILG